MPYVFFSFSFLGGWSLSNHVFFFLSVLRGMLKGKCGRKAKDKREMMEGKTDNG